MTDAYGTQGGMFSRDKTHCKHGHEFDDENTRWVRRPSKRPGQPDTWRRSCRKCQHNNKIEHLIRKYAAELAAEKEQELKSAG